MKNAKLVVYHRTYNCSERDKNRKNLDRRQGSAKGVHSTVGGEYQSVLLYSSCWVILWFLPWELLRHLLLVEQCMVNVCLCLECECECLQVSEYTYIYIYVHI